MISIVFASNYFNHHERFFCDELNHDPNVKFKFIQTEAMTEERKALGWGIDLNDFPYVICAYDSPDIRQKCIELCNTCDVLILGSAPYEYVARRVKENKLTFYYAERLFRKGIWHMLNPRTFITVLRRFIIPGRKSSFYLLAASGYTAKDTARIFAFNNRRFKWGHFIEVSQPARKFHTDDKVVKLLWAGRLISLKHPDYALRLAKHLKELGVRFHIDIIGTGELEAKMKEDIFSNGLEDVVMMHGAKKPEEVRQYMECSDIFLFTSDFNEGWGAVLGEALTSGCAVVTSHGIGATPFLVADQKNGLIYQTGSYKSFENKVMKLMTNPKLRMALASNGIKTMIDLWNAATGAKRFYQLSTSLINEGVPLFFDKGPLSKAEILSNYWYHDDTI